MKGRRMNISVAPTYFMMLISLRRLNTVILMVLAMIIEATPMSSSTMAAPPRLTACLMMVMVWATCSGART